MKTKDEILEFLLEKDLLTFRSDGCNKRYIDGNKFFYDNVAHKIENVYGVYYDKEYKKYVFFVTSGMHGGEIEFYSEHDYEDKAFCALYDYVEREDKLWRKDEYELKNTRDLQWKKWDIAKNEKIPTDILKHLSNDRDLYVRAAVAGNPITPTKVLMKLNNECEYEINLNLAENPSCPISILQTLSSNEKNEIRRGVAWNHNTPIEILKRLSSDSDLWVRTNIANNPNTPIDQHKKRKKNKFRTI